MRSTRPSAASLGKGLVIGLVLVLTAAGGATAGALITGAQIKNGTITSKDVKDKTLRLKDLRPGDVATLEGEDGFSALDPVPSGSLVVGGGHLRLYGAGAGSQESYSPLPFTIALDDDQDGRNLFFQPSNYALDTEENLECAGSSQDPDPAPGLMCVYFTGGFFNLTLNSARLYAGTGSVSDASDSHGFLLDVQTPGAGTTQLRYVWAYRAP